MALGGSKEGASIERGGPPVEARDVTLVGLAPGGQGHGTPEAMHKIDLSAHSIVWIRTTRVLATLLLLFVLLAPSRSSAASPEEQAAVIYKQAVKAMNAGRDPEAVAKMREAFEVFPRGERLRLLPAPVRHDLPESWPEDLFPPRHDRRLGRLRDQQ